MKDLINSINFSKTADIMVNMFELMSEVKVPNQTVKFLENLATKVLNKRHSSYNILVETDEEKIAE